MTSMQTADIISCCTLALTVLGGLGALWQWHKATQIRRAEFIKELYDTFSQNDMIRRGIYLIDYQQTWYDTHFHESADNAKSNSVAINETLVYINYVCYLNESGVFSKHDFLLFQYELDRALINLSMQDYLYNLYHFSQAQRTEFPFPVLLAYAKKNKIFGSEFFDKKSCQSTPSRFHHYLNF